MRLLILGTVAVWLTAEMAFRIRQRRRSAPTITREWRSLAAIYVAAVLASVLSGVLARHVPALDLPLRGAAGTAVALLVAWCGITLRLWAIAALGKYFRGTVHIQQQHELVRSGPYRVLRHPSYTGLLVALFGLSLPFANLAAILIFNGCILAAVLYRIRTEERVLLDGLGEQYADYMRHTRRLIPGVW